MFGWFQRPFPIAFNIVVKNLNVQQNRFIRSTVHDAGLLLVALLTLYIPISPLGALIVFLGRPRECKLTSSPRLGQ